MAIPAIAALLGRAGGFGMAATAGVEALGTANIAKAGAQSLVGAGIGGEAPAAMKKLGEATKGVGKEAKQSASGLDQFRNSARKASVDFVIAKAAIAGLSGRIASALTEPLDILATAAQPLVHLVALSNPATAEQFTLAMNDAYAIIGRITKGPLEMFTRLMRRLGDIYATVEPSLTRIANTTAYWAELVGGALLDGLEASLPLFEMLADVFDLLAPALQSTVGLLKLLAAGIEMFNAAATLGYKKPVRQSAVGAAVRDVQITESGADFARRSQQKAFGQAFAEMSGQGAGKTQEDVPNILQDILTWIDTNIPKASELPDLIGAIIAQVWTSNKPSAGDAEHAIQFGVGGDLINYLRSMVTR